MRNATRICVLLVAAGCAHGRTPGGAAQADAGAGADANVHAADASSDAAADGASDAGCAISAGVTPAIDGVADLADYPSAQQLALGAMLGSDGAAIAWDRDHLYVTVSSSAFTNAYEPLHVYVEAVTSLDTVQPAQGKEYSGLVPELPFTPTHLIAARRVTDSGTGAYDGVFVPAGGWQTRQTGIDPYVSSDQQTLSVVVPWTALGGCPTAMRLAFHIVHAVTANEWKDLAPSTHTPWQAPGGGYYEIDLTKPPAVSGWALR